MPDRVVVVGASLAGLRTAEALRAEGHTGALTLVGEEPHPPYDRPPLSKAFLTDDADVDALHLPHTLDAELRLGVGATSVDTDTRTLILDDGSDLPYDALVVATGTTPVIPDGLDTGLAGVHVLRTASDALALRRDLAA